MRDDSVSSLELRSCLKAIVEWAKIMVVKLAPTKFTVMRVRSGHCFKCSPSYRISIASLPVVANCTDLGVSFHNRHGLFVSPHIWSLHTVTVISCISHLDPDHISCSKAIKNLRFSIYKQRCVNLLDSLQCMPVLADLAFCQQIFFSESPII